MTMSMSIREYARHRGVSHTAVRKALQTGRIHLDADGKIDPAQADSSWANNTRSSVATSRGNAQRVETSPEQTTERQVSSGAPDYNKARAVKEFYAARLAKLEFEEREGKLVNIDEINVQHFNRARRLRDRLLMIPRRLAAQLAAETDTRSVEEALDAAICEALEELSDITRSGAPAL